MHHRQFAYSLAGCALVALTTGCGSGTAIPSSPIAPTTTRQQPIEAKQQAIAAGAGTTAAKQRPKLQPGAKTKVLAPAGDKPFDKTFDDIRFDIALEDRFHRDMLPDSIKAMFGERIRIRGFILPTAQKSGIREFVLVRDNQECCFGPGAAIYDCIFVEMNKKETAEFSIRPVAVEGKFGLKEIIGPDGRHLAIYHLEGETVQ